MYKKIITALAAILFGAFALAAQVKDYAGDPAYQIEQGEELVAFHFRPAKTSLWALVQDNIGTLRDFEKVIEANKADIMAGRLLVRVNGYCSSMPTVRQNLEVVKVRTNHVKSWFIVNNGLREEHFRTFNAARSFKGMSEVVIVAYLEVVDETEEPELPSIMTELVPTPVKEEPVREPDLIVELEPELPPTDSEWFPPVVQEKRPFRPMFSLKTNLISWAGVMPWDFKHYSFVPNLELEWYFGRRFSVAGSAAYMKRTVGDDQFFGIASYVVEPRFWFNGDGNFKWFYVGVYGQVGDFDNQNMRIDHFGKTGAFFGGGLSAGVMIPFGNRVGLELGVRAGYYNRETDFYSYEAPNYYRDWTETDNKFGITGVKASFVYRFGKGKNSK